MTIRIKYVGPHDGVEIEHAPKLWVTVSKGEIVEVGDELGESLLMQPDNWSKASPAKKSEKEDS